MATGINSLFKFPYFAENYFGDDAGEIYKAAKVLINIKKHNVMQTTKAVLCVTKKDWANKEFREHFEQCREKTLEKLDQAIEAWREPEEFLYALDLYNQLKELKND